MSQQSNSKREIRKGELAAVGFVDAWWPAEGPLGENPQTLRPDKTDYYVYPRDITWKEMRQEIADLREHYERVNLLENEIVIFDMLDKEGILENPDIAFELKNTNHLGESRRILLNWSSEVANTLILTMDLKFPMDIVFTDKEKGSNKGKRVVFI